MKAISFLLLIVFMFIGPSHAADSTPASVGDGSDEKKWAVETSLTFPLVRIYMVQFRYFLGKQNAVVFGPCFQNWKGETTPNGQAQAYTVILGYRHGIWKQLHLEVELFPAYNIFKSGIDGRLYKGFELWAEYRIGWQFDIKAGRQKIYLSPQPGIMHAWYMEKIWPGIDKKAYRTKSIAFNPQMIVGFSF